MSTRTKKKQRRQLERQKRRLLREKRSSKSTVRELTEPEAVVDELPQVEVASKSDAVMEKAKAIADTLGNEYGAKYAFDQLGINLSDGPNEEPKPHPEDNLVGFAAKVGRMQRQNAAGKQFGFDDVSPTAESEGNAAPGFATAVTRMGANR